MAARRSIGFPVTRAVLPASDEKAASGTGARAVKALGKTRTAAPFPFGRSVTSNVPAVTFFTVARTSVSLKAVTLTRPRFSPSRRTFGRFSPNPEPRMTISVRREPSAGATVSMTWSSNSWTTG